MAASAAVLLGAGATVGSAQTPVVDEHTEVEPTDGGALAQGARSGAAKVKEVGTAGSSSGPRSYEIGFGEPLFTLGDSELQRVVLDEAADVSGDVARLFFHWRAIAPAAPSASFDPTDPGSPEYSWDRYDTAVEEARARGLRVLILVASAPDWAEGANRPNDVDAGTWKPNPADVADFGSALAERYSGDFGSLPRVRDFIFWNEPNLEDNLTPVWKGGKGTKPAAPSHYRKMLNAFYDAVKAVDSSIRVVSAGTAPYGADPGIQNMRPLVFWRELLCLRGNGHKNLRSKKCSAKPQFDVLAHHPINTSGGPTLSAISPDDVSTPDLKNLIKVLRAAEQDGNVLPKGKRPVWATELWWESNPPDPAAGNPGLRRQAEWYAEAMYLIWKQGASMVLPYQVRDEAFFGGPGRTSFQTGVFFVDGQPKPSSRAVRFPFVADRTSKKKVKLWGKAPTAGKLLVERKVGKGFKKVAEFTVNPSKVFYETVKLRKGQGKYVLRATVNAEESLAWKLK